MIKLKEGQKVVAEDGSIYEIEKGDLVETVSLQEKDSFIDFVARVADMTDYNDHGGAVLEVAKYFKLKKYVKIMSLVNEIHDIEESMPSELGRYRSTLLDQLLEFAKKNLDQEEYDMLYQAF